MYVINPNDEESKGLHWASLFINRLMTVYFDSFGIECIQQEVFSKITDKQINLSLAKYLE